MLDVETQAAKLSKTRAQDSELRRQWRPINLDKSRFTCWKGSLCIDTLHLTLSGIILGFCDACSYWKDGFGCGLCYIDVWRWYTFFSFSSCWPFGFESMGNGTSLREFKEASDLYVVSCIFISNTFSLFFSIFQVMAFALWRSWPRTFCLTAATPSSFPTTLEWYCEVLAQWLMKTRSCCASQVCVQWQWLALCNIHCFRCYTFCARCCVYEAWSCRLTGVRIMCEVVKQNFIHARLVAAWRSKPSWRVESRQKGNETLGQDRPPL